MRQHLTSWPAKIVLALLLLLSGVGVGWTAHTEQRPYCPTEDSCAIDYRDGAWHIEETVP